MKRLLIYTGLFITAGALLMQLIQSNSGYILISIGAYTLEMSFWFGVFALLAIGALFYYLTKGIKRGLRLFSIWPWLSDSREKTAIKLTNRGLISYIEGDWATAKKKLLKAAKTSEQPLLNYLAAARSAHELGLHEETQFLLREAEKIAPQKELAIALSQARMQFVDGKLEQCIATLTRAKEHAPNHPLILDLLRQAYWKLKDWPALGNLLPLIRKAKVMTENEFNAFQSDYYLALLSDLNQKLYDEKYLLESWQKIPKMHQKNTALILCFVKLLLEIELTERAYSLIRQTLKRDWNEELICLFGQVKSDDLQAQLLLAESWLREHPGDPELLLALGRLSVHCQLWGKARDYLQKSLRIREKPETYVELANLLAQLGEHQQSMDLYKIAMGEKAAKNKRKTPMITYHSKNENYSKAAH